MKKFSIFIFAIFFLFGLFSAAQAQLPSSQFPDLWISSQSLFLRPDGLRFTVINIGNAPVTQSIHFLLQWVDGAGSAVGGSRGFSIDDDLAPSLSRGDRVEVNVNNMADVLRYVSEQPSGASRLRIIVNDNRAFTEGFFYNDQGYTVIRHNDYSNNTVTAIPTVRGVDLRVDNVSYSGAQGLVFTVTNGGTADMNKDCLVRWDWLDRQGRDISGERSTVRLAAGASRVETFSPANRFLTAIPINAAKIRVRVDFEDEWLESDENNNTREINRQELPDFVIVNPILEKDRLRAEVRNDGNLTVAPPGIRLHWLDRAGNVIDRGDSLLIQGGNTLAPGQSILYDSDISVSAYSRVDEYVSWPPGGANRLRLEVDSTEISVGGSYVESNEENNIVELERPRTDPALKDGVLSQLPGSGYTWGRTEFGLRFTITNNSSVPIAGPLPFRFEWLNNEGNVVGSPFETPLFSSVILNEGTNVLLDYLSSGPIWGTELPLRNFIISPPEEAVSLKVKVDPLENIPDDNRENNILIIHRPFPNLVFGHVSLTADYLSFVLSNNSSVNAWGPFLIKFQWLDANDEPLGPGEVYQQSELAANRQTVLDSTGLDRRDPRIRHPEFDAMRAYISQPPQGAVSLRLEADSSHVVQEESENDNVAGAIPLLPDLYFEGSNVFNRDQMILGFRNGPNTGAVYQPVNFRFEWLDENGNVLSTPVSSFAYNPETESATRCLLPNSQYVINTSNSNQQRALRWVFDSGDHPAPYNATHLRAIIDPDNQLREQDESNNTVLLIRPMSDIAVESAVVTDSLFSLTVMNRGARPYDGRHTGDEFEWQDRNGNRIGEPYRYSYDSNNYSDYFYGPFRSATDPYERTFTVTPTSTQRYYDRGFQPFIFNPPAEAYKLVIRLDYTNLIQENSERNNIVEVLRVVAETSEEEIMESDEADAREAVESELAEEEPAQEQPSQEAVRARTSPGTLPYLVKNLAREVQSTFTFDPQKKAELRLRFATEKILETDDLVAKGKAEQAVKHLKNYEQDLQKIDNLIGKIEKKNPEAAEEFAAKVFRNQLKQQVLVGEVEKKAPVDALGELKNTQLKIADHIGTTIAAIENKEKVGEITLTTLSQDGSPFKPLRNLEVLKAIEEKVPEQAKEAILQAQENALKRFKNQIEALPEEHQELLSGYIEKTGGNEMGYLKIFDDLKFEEIGEKTQDNIVAAKEKLLSRLEGKISEANQKDPILAKKILSNLSGGTIENLRVIKDIEDNFDPKLASLIVEVKKEAIEKFQAKIEALDTVEKKQDFVNKVIAPSLDIKQIEILKEVKVADILISTQVKQLEKITPVMPVAPKITPEPQIELKPKAVPEPVIPQVSPIEPKLQLQPTIEPTPTPISKPEPIIPSEPIKEIISIPTPTPTPIPIKLVPVEPALTPKPILYPDLIVFSPSYSPSVPIEGNLMTFSATVKNQGEASAGTSAAYLHINGILLGKASVAALAAGQTTTLTFKEIWTASAGSHIIEICADVAVSINESDENNNCLSQTFAVSEKVILKPDLTVTTPSVKPSSPVSGSLLTLWGIVKNQGNEKVDNVTGRLRIDIGNDGKWDILPKDVSIGLLSSNTTGTLGWEGVWSATQGTHKFEVCADAVSLVAESNESNNCVSSLLIIK